MTTTSSSTPMAPSATAENNISTTNTTTTTTNTPDASTSLHNHHPQQQKKSLKEVGAFMKQLESSQCSCRLTNQKPIIFRLDGHKFSTYARAFRKPFDVLLHEIMIETCKDLMDEYSSVTTVYTMSDEITMYVPVTRTKHGELAELAYGGKLIKTCSLMAGFASCRFNHHAQKFLSKWTEQDFETRAKFEKLQETIRDARAFFDARAHNLDSEYDVLQNLLWRCLHDCSRNSKNNLGRAHYSAKALHGLKAQQVVEKLRTEKNIDWNECHPGYKYGTTIKKKRVKKECLNPKTGETVTVVRSAYTSMAFRYNSGDKYIQMLNAKYWDDLPDEVFAFFLPDDEKHLPQPSSKKKKKNKKRKRDEK